MASPPDYDKEPKAPDKNGTNVNHEHLKSRHNSAGDQLLDSDAKTHNFNTTTEAENKHVETLDDGQLRALLDEAITYKCPKDREGKSSLFKELLEEVELDEQACEAAARELTGSRGRRAGKGRRQLPHSNSLQDLVAALAAEAAPRRRAAHAPPAQVSARAIHGGSLPSGVDTSFLLSEEPTRGGYLATVRCVNPPPLSERRVSVDSTRSDNEPRRSKPSSSVGVTYTARATLEIGGASRAVTTTSPSNQDKLMTALASKNKSKGGGHTERDQRKQPRRPHRDHGLQTTNKEKRHAQTLPANKPRKTNNTEEQKPKLPDEQAKAKKQNSKATHSKLEHKQNKEQNIKSSKYGNYSAHKNLSTDNPVSEALNSSIANWYKNLEGFSMPKIKTDGADALPLKSAVSTDKELKIPSNKDPNFMLNTLPSKKSFIPKCDPLTPKEMLQKSRMCEDYDDIKIDHLKYNIDDWYKGLDEYSNMIEQMTVLDKLEPSFDHLHPCTSSSIEIHDTAKSERVCDGAVLSQSDKAFLCKKTDFRMWKPKSNVLDSFKFRTFNKSCDHVEDSNVKLKALCDENTIDTKLRKIYRKSVGDLTVPRSSDVNDINIRRMTIGEPVTVSSPSYNNNTCKQANKLEVDSKESKLTSESADTTSDSNIKSQNTEAENQSCQTLTNELNDKPKNKGQDILALAIQLSDLKNEICQDIEMIDFPKSAEHSHDNSFSRYLEEQQKLFKSLESSNYDKNLENVDFDNNVIKEVQELKHKQGKLGRISKETVIEMGYCGDVELQEINLASQSGYDILTDDPEKMSVVVTNEKQDNENGTTNGSLELGGVAKDEAIESEIIFRNEVSSISREVVIKTKPEELYVIAELSNNAYIFLTLPKCLPTPNQDTATVPEIENNNVKPYAQGEKKHKKKKNKQPSADSEKKTVINKDILRELLFENLFKNVPASASRANLTTIKRAEVDSTIPFNCITTPEVVTSCNTTSPSAPSAAIIDPKPLQLASTYRAVASVTGAGDDVTDTPDDPGEDNGAGQPRGAVTSGVNGLPLSRPYPATTLEEYKKSLDENGNAVLSGSSQHKKPRRKKSSKNETVIKSHQIDGYQGNKDLNEVLRFIESHAARPKLRKHRDEEEKKARGGRRKEKGDAAPRAASLEEVSRTTLEELTAAPAADAADAPDADFTTVTKRRARRRREPAAAPPVPDLISSCEYPALLAPRRPPAPRRAPDLVCDRRPPVLLRAPPHDAAALHGLTFGFELNEALLGAAPAASPAPAPAPCPAPCPAPRPRYVPPAADPDPRLLDRLVTYVAHAWEEVMKCGAGKVRYFSE